jgi:hypothetical protein
MTKSGMASIGFLLAVSLTGCGVPEQPDAEDGAQVAQAENQQCDPIIPGVNFTCQCVVASQHPQDVQTQLCCVGLTPLFAVLCPPDPRTIVCSTFYELCRKQCEPDDAGCLSICEGYNETVCKLGINNSLCNHAAAAAAWVCDHNRTEIPSTDECKPGSAGCEVCCLQAGSTPTRVACLQRCALN